jgi:hypothetical protein
VVLTPAPTATAPPALVITAPAEGSQVGVQVAVAGMLNTDLCAGCAVYVVIRPEPIEAPQTRWYGQDEAAAVEPGAGFALGGVNLGRNSNDDDCKWFDIWVVVSTTDGRHSHGDQNGPPCPSWPAPVCACNAPRRPEPLRRGRSTCLISRTTGPSWRLFARLVGIAALLAATACPNVGTPRHPPRCRTTGATTPVDAPSVTATPPALALELGFTQPV